ncbi:hypothetical protein HDU93_009311, partial [Gonapodya sp. JEL0774]
QLVGCISLFVASKYEELRVTVLTISHIVTLCAGYYTPTTVYEMEKRVLGVLDFDLGFRG